MKIYGEHVLWTYVFSERKSYAIHNANRYSCLGRRKSNDMSYYRRRRRRWFGTSLRDRVCLQKLVESLEKRVANLRMGLKTLLMQSAQYHFFYTIHFQLLLWERSEVVGPGGRTVFLQWPLLA